MNYPKHLKRQAKLWNILEFKDVLIVGLVFFISSRMFRSGEAPIVMTTIVIGVIKVYDWCFSPGAFLFFVNNLGKPKSVDWKVKLSDLSN